MMQLNYWKLSTSAALAMTVLLAGCGGGGSGTDGNVNGVQFTINSPAQIAQESATDYNANTNGLITGATLHNWINDWNGTRPAGITGKLVILQIAAGPTGTEYFKSDGANVFTYLSPASEWLETRTNGVVQTVSMVPEGAAMDALLKKYNIDPTRDMIVAAMGTGSAPNAMGQGRIWYALRYWGVDKTHLALLNGGNMWGSNLPDGLTAGDYQATASTAPDNGTFSVKNLLVDNTQLQATLEDMINILPSTDANNKSDGIFLWDARSMSQYTAGEVLEKGESDKSVTPAVACASAYCTAGDSGNYMWSFQNSGSRQGHPRGAVNLQYIRLLDATKGYSYRPKSELADLLNGKTDAATGTGFVDGSNQLVGEGNAYQSGDVVYTYCETTLRAMITGVTSAVILGKPTRFYDGAMTEWNSLSNLQDNTGNFILPSNSPWRTDVVSFFRPATSYTLVAPRTITNAYATSANAIVNEDKAYKTGESTSTGGSGGTTLPGNPCGG